VVSSNTWAYVTGTVSNPTDLPTFSHQDSIPTSQLGLQLKPATMDPIITQWATACYNIYHFLTFNTNIPTTTTQPQETQKYINSLHDITTTSQSPHSLHVPHHNKPLLTPPISPTITKPIRTHFILRSTIICPTILYGLCLQ